MRHALTRAAQDDLLGPTAGSPDNTDTLCLLASELATNAVTHTSRQDNSDQLFEVTLWTADQYLWIAIADPSPDPPVQRDSDDGSSNGRGLLLVSILATTWGSTPRAGGIGGSVELTADHPPYRVAGWLAWGRGFISD